MRNSLMTVAGALALQACALGGGSGSGGVAQVGVAPTAPSPTGQRIGFVHEDG